MTPSTQPLVLLIGTNASLAYLIERYAELSGLSIHIMPTIPPAQVVLALHPAAVLFLSLANLEVSQPRIAELESSDIPLLVCSAATDEARARELGADYCLEHPLTYDHFLTALQAAPRARSV